MKRLVICCDGTWATPDKRGKDGLPCPTNVTRLARAVTARDPAGRQQLLFYQRGVGTGPRDHLAGGLFGVGLSRNVKEAYAFVVANYVPGDEIFLFGFSRGAYTARSTAGFIRNCGILRREHRDRLDDAYRLYRRRDDASHPTGVEAELFRKSFSYEGLGKVTRITCIAVWDTVGAHGIPIGFLGRISPRLLHLTFHDVALSSYVDNAFQALAIDERRAPYTPAIWTQQPHVRDSAQRVEQVWFAGAHNDIGGGETDTGLSDIALGWIVRRARECGLGVDDALLRDGFDPRFDAPIHNSRRGIFLLSGTNDREMHPSNDFPRHEAVHALARTRYDTDSAYRPKNLSPDPVISPSSIRDEQHDAATREVTLARADVPI